MNKLLIVLLAVCLVSTHAFVKRDAPEAQSELQKQAAEAQAKLTELAKSIADATAKALDPEVVKKNVEDALKAAQDYFNKLNPTPAPAGPNAA